MVCNIIKFTYGSSGINKFINKLNKWAENEIRTIKHKDFLLNQDQKILALTLSEELRQLLENETNELLQQFKNHPIFSEECSNIIPITLQYLFLVHLINLILTRKSEMLPSIPEWWTLAIANPEQQFLGSIDLDPSFFTLKPNQKALDDFLYVCNSKYALCMISALPKNGIPEREKIYLKKQKDNTVYYTVLSPTRKTSIGFLNVKLFPSLKEGVELTQAYLDQNQDAILANILEVTFQKGHTHGGKRTCTVISNEVDLYCAIKNIILQLNIKDQSYNLGIDVAFHQVETFAAATMPAVGGIHSVPDPIMLSPVIKGNNYFALPGWNNAPAVRAIKKDIQTSNVSIVEKILTTVVREEAKKTSPQILAAVNQRVTQLSKHVFFNTEYSLSVWLQGSFALHLLNRPGTRPIWWNQYVICELLKLSPSLLSLPLSFFSINPSNEAIEQFNISFNNTLLSANNWFQLAATEKAEIRKQLVLMATQQPFDYFGAKLTGVQLLFRQGDSISQDQVLSEYIRAFNVEFLKDLYSIVWNHELASGKNYKDYLEIENSFIMLIKQISEHQFLKAPLPLVFKYFFLRHVKEFLLAQQDLNKCNRFYLNCLYYSIDELGLTKIFKTLDPSLFKLQQSYDSAAIKQFMITSKDLVAHQADSKHYIVTTISKIEKAVQQKMVNAKLRFILSNLELVCLGSYNKIVKTTTGIPFMRISVADDGDCGFTAFGITREEAIKLLVDNIANQQVISLLQQPLREVMFQQGFRDYIAQNNVFPEYVARFDKLIAMAQTRNKRNNKERRANKLKEELEFQCINDLNFLLWYINYDLKDKQVDLGWAHPAVLQALAEIQGLGLNIFVLAEEQTLLISHNFYPRYNQHAEQQINLMFINGNHFERLELLDPERYSLLATQQATSSFFGNSCASLSSAVTLTPLATLKSSKILLSTDSSSDVSELPKDQGLAPKSGNKSSIKFYKEWP